MSGFPDFNPGDALTEENDPVWRLLEQEPFLEPDAWFTVRTLARCRYAGLAVESRRQNLRRAWRWILGAGCGVGLAVLLVARLHPHNSATTSERNVQEAFAILASLGDDSYSTPSSANPPSWQDSSL